MTDKELLAQAQAEIAALKAAASGRVTFHVSVPRAPGTNGPEDKGAKGGGITARGINGRFGVTLYKEDWESLMHAVKHLPGFIEANKEKLNRPPLGSTTNGLVTELKR